VACERSCLITGSGSGFNTDNVEVFARWSLLYKNVARVNKVMYDTVRAGDTTLRSRDFIMIMNGSISDATMLPCGAWHLACGLRT